MNFNLPNVLLRGVLCFAALLFFWADTFAAGLIIPANCTVNVDSCNLIVSGDIVNSGTLTATSGTITLSGSWISSGVFTSGTGTVTFNATAGVQLLNTGGLANAFYNVTHNGAGTVQLTANPADINNSFTNTAGTFDANSLNMNVGKDWTNTAAYTPGTNTVTLDGTAQTISGTSTFYRLTKMVSSPDTLTFSANGADETTVTRTLTLKGASGNLLTLDKSGANSQSKLKLQPGGSQSLQYLHVFNNNATGIMLVAGPTSTDGGNNTNWAFGNVTITWTGTVSTDWDDPFNWDLGLVPAPGDTAVIPPIGGTIAYQPQLSTNITIGNLTIQANASVTLNGNNMTVSTTLFNAGNLILNGSETLNITQDTAHTGTVTYVGTGTGATITVKDFGANDYANLVINDTHGTLDTFVTNAALTAVNNVTVSGGTLNISTNTNTLTVSGNLTVNGGTLTATNGVIDVNGNVDISSGVLTAPSSLLNTAFTVAGNWSHTGGTFTAGSGKVTFDGTNQTVSGNSTFYNVRKVVAAAATLTLESGSTQVITHDLTLSGAAGQLLTIISSSTPTQANLTLQGGGTQYIHYVNVKDNNATGVQLVGRSASVDSGHNTNWIFGGTTMTWTGITSTDWDDATNWDIGLVPLVDDVAIIANAGAQPATLATNVQLTTLTVNNGASVNLNGKDLQVSGTLTNNGTISRFGNETVTFGTMDTAHGTFIFTGNGDGVADVFTISDYGATDYYNITINDTHATKDTFRTNAAFTVNGALTVSSGTLDTSTNSNAVVVNGAITVNGGTFTAANSTIDANSNVTVSSGVLTAPASTGDSAFTVAGNWAHSGGTFTHSSGKVTFDGTGQSITGDTTFYRLRKVVVAADTLTFGAASTQTIANDITLTGASGQLLRLRSDGSPTAAKLTLQTGGTQTISYADVMDSDASGGLTLVARNSSLNSGNNTHWLFGSATITWTGTASTDWDTQTNWDLGLVPSSIDTAIIPDTSGTTTRYPILASNVTVTVLTLQDPASALGSNGRNLTVSDTLTNNGTITFTGGETVEVTTVIATAGTIVYTGTGAAATFTPQISDPSTHNVLANEFFNLTINDASNNGTFVRTADVHVAGALSISGGNLDISTNAKTMTVDGNTSISAGTLTATNGNIDMNGALDLSGTGAMVAPTTAKSFTLAGSFSRAAGATFTPSNGRVTLDTTATATFTGDTTFYDLESTTADKQIRFTAGSTQTVTHTLSFLGVRDHNIVLNSTTPGTSWNIAFPNSVQTANALTVQDSNALTNQITCLNCTDSGNNNSNWIFSPLKLTAPDDGRTVGQTPVLVGLAAPNTKVRIKGLDTTGTEVIVATTTADSNGNFRVILGHDDDGDAGTTVTSGVQLRVSSAANDNYLIPYIMTVTAIEVAGLQSDVTVVATPTSAQVPQISSPINNQRLSGPKPVFTGTGAPSQTVTIVANDAAGALLLTTVGTGTTDASGNFSFALTTPMTKGTNYVSAIVDGVSSDLIQLTLTDPFGVVFDSSSNRTLKSATVSLYRASDNQLAEKSTCDSNGNITVLKDIDCHDTNPFVTDDNGAYSFLAAAGNYYITVAADAYQYPSILTTFPSNRSITTGSKGDQFTVGATVLEIDHPMDANGFLLRIEKAVNKGEVRVGDVVTYTIQIKNLSADNPVHSILLDDRIPAGFKYLADRVLLDGVPIDEPTGNRPLIFKIGSLEPGQTKILKYQLVVGSGVVPGNYDNVAVARYNTSVIISNRASTTVKVVMDPLFDLGTLIGKVFYDLNENGVQDAPVFDPTEGTTIIEKPIPNVQIVMEDGTIITTDREGKYSVPGVVPGRHILRVDERTLPPGTFLTTEKAVIVDVTQGAMVKANFGINNDNEHVVSKDARFFNEKIALTQDRNRPVTRLNAALLNQPYEPPLPSTTPMPTLQPIVPPTIGAAAPPPVTTQPVLADPNMEQIVMYNGTLLRQAEFRLFANYTPFIDKWRLEIIDADTKKLIRKFEGNRFTFNDPIYWNGRTDDDRMVQSEHKYAYVLTVLDEKGNKDMTREKPITIHSIETEDEYKKAKERIEKEDMAQVRVRADDYERWVQAQSALNITDRQTIPINGETIVINRQGQDIKALRLLKENTLFADIPVQQGHGLTPQEVMAGGLQATASNQTIDLVVPNGDYTLQVVGPKTVSLSEEAAAPVVFPSERPSTGVAAAPAVLAPAGPGSVESYSRPLRVGDDYLMFVGMGDAKVGYTFDRGNVEAVRPDDKFKNGFWHEGSAAYYLKGKILGKYLVTSTFDTDRERKEMFRHLDPNAYYPLYGDQSSINYDATNTQGPLYLLVEWDKSSAIWGNYAIDFNDTEFTQFSRSYYGGKIDYQSVATNPYGDARTKVVLFHAEIRERSAHNEFLGTGGSLYFLKNKDVVQGSDKISIQVRDKITGLVLAAKDMKNGADYELDEGQGRILFWQPISMIAKSESLVATSLLDGNPVYVVADYQYKVKDKLNESSEGARVAQGVGDNVVVGSTYVNETQSNNNYQLRGQDVTAHLGDDATVRAEYATSHAVGTDAYISTDGGITFEQLQAADQRDGKAYGISGDSRLFNRFGLSAYYKWIGDSFSTAATSAQQGKEMGGLKLTFDLTPATRVTASQDIQRLINSGTLQAVAQVGASETSTTIFQIVHETERMKITGAYQIQNVTNRIGDFVTSTNQVSKALAGRVDYALNGRVTLSLGQQFDVLDPTNNITTIGAQARLIAGLNARVQEAFSKNGTATTLGLFQNVNDKLTLSTDYTMAYSNDGRKDDTVTLGAEQKFNDNMSATGSVAVTNSSTGEQSTTAALAGRAKMSDTVGVDATVGKTVTSSGAERSTATLGAGAQVNESAAVRTAVSVNDEKGAGQTKTINLQATNAVGVAKTSTDVQVDQDATGAKKTTVTFGDQIKINEQMQAVSQRSFGTSQDGTTTGSTYGLQTNKDNRKVQATVTREQGDSKSSGISQSNIFGLSGDVNDKLALQGTLEKGNVQNLDGTRTHRTAMTAGAGYVWRDPETTMERLKNSTKIELRMDTGANAAQQYVFYNAIEGRITENMSVSAKINYSRTWSTETNQTQQRSKEVILGAAYRPVNFDRLNLIAQYSYKENQGPSGQFSASTTDVEATRTEVMAGEAVYDINDAWQLAEKVALRINDEKVTGFDFTRTHTWLMIHRLNYKLDRNWTVSGEYRKLTQAEAKDTKQGFLLEATRNINDNAQLGIGWNFTQFNDDMTNLNFASQGPFLRMTGKLYDRTPEEKARARAKWLDARVTDWAWVMVRRELKKPESKVAGELNRMFALAQSYQKDKKYNEAQQVYKDIIIAGQMMFDEAAEYIRRQIAFEEKLQDYNKTAEDYFSSGEYLKARKLWEKIVDDAQKRMIQ